MFHVEHSVKHCQHREAVDSVARIRYIVIHQKEVNALQTAIRRQYRVGSDSHAARLTERDVVEIRRRHNDGVTIKRLKDDYGVSWSCIKAVVTRRSWKHVL